MIHKAMIGIMRDVDAIKKDKFNPNQKFKFRGIDDVINSLHESFAKNGVYIMQEVLNRHEVERKSSSGGALFYITLTIKFRFIAEDGSFTESIISGTAMDSGDKADNKCMSIATKYCLLIAFLIPTEDIIDPDGQTHEVKPTETTPKPANNVKVTVPPNAWVKVVERVSNGETAIIPLIRKTYILNQDQESFLQQYEPKN